MLPTSRVDDFGLSHSFFITKDTSSRRLSLIFNGLVIQPVGTKNLFAKVPNDVKSE